VKVIGLCGFAQSGKDTAASFLVERGFTRLAFADILRQSLYNLNPMVRPSHEFRPVTGPVQLVRNLLQRVVRSVPIHDQLDHRQLCRVQDIVDVVGWDKAKVDFPEIRHLLQRLGTEVGRDLYGENFWVDRVGAQMQIGGNYVITDVRFPNEADFIHRRGGNLFRIDRGNRAANGHASENVEALKVDGVIPNTGSLDHFREVVLEAAGLK